MFVSITRWTIVLCGAWVLIACGGAQPEASAPRATALPRPTPTATVAPTSAVPAIESRYADLAQAQTPEGYYVLGDPAAPLVMNHYSDFL